MSEIKHTPGPWWASPAGTVESENGLICDCGFFNVHTAEDARLIAAAPDLLASAIRLVKAADETINDNRDDMYIEYGLPEAIEAMKEVIAKAAGKGVRI